MSEQQDDVVTVAAGDAVTMELCQQALAEAGIKARVVGEALDSSFGTAIPLSVQLWVLRADEERARAAVARWEQERGRTERHAHHFPRPQNEPKPSRGDSHGPHGHYHKDPGNT